MPITIDVAECTGCGACTEACPTGAITVEEHAKLNIEECAECGACVEQCPAGVIRLD